MITAKIFAQKDYIARDGQIPIKLRLTIHRKVFPPISLNKRTRPADWNDSTGRVLDTHPNAYLLNKLLDQVQAKADDVLLKHELSGRVITYESFIREFNDYSPYDFYYLCDQFYDSKKTESWGYREKIRHTVNKLKDYCPQLELHQIDYAFIIKYVNHLKTKETKKNGQNTINTNIAIFRRIMRHGIKLKLIRENPFLEYRIVSIKSNREALSLDEVKLLQDLFRFRLPYYLRNTLTWFLLAVATGRRYGDMKGFANWTFTNEHIRIIQDKQINGRENKKVIMIYMNDLIRTLIGLINDNKFKLPSDQKLNKYLKELAELAGIKDKVITFHCARHTFASINKKLTDDLTVRRDLLGHDSIKSTLIYEHTDEEILKDTMKKWNAL